MGADFFGRSLGNSNNVATPLDDVDDALAKERRDLSGECRRWVRIVGPSRMPVLHVQTPFGFEIEKIPGEDIVARLIPDVPDPVEEIGGPPGSIRRGTSLRPRSRR